MISYSEALKIVDKYYGVAYQPIASPGSICRPSVASREEFERRFPHGFKKLIKTRVARLE